MTDTLRTAHNLVLVYQNQGKYVKMTSSSLFLYVLSYREEIL